MPIYEYQCEKCGHCFENLMFAGDDENHFRCPACGTAMLWRMIYS